MSSRTSSKTNSRTNASANASASDATIPKIIFNNLEDIKYELLQICDIYIKNNSNYFKKHSDTYTNILKSEFYIKTEEKSTTNNLKSSGEVSKRIKLFLYRFKTLDKMCKSIHYILKIFLDFISALLVNKKYFFAESDDIRNIITQLKLTKKESFSKIKSFFSTKSAVKRRNSVRAKKMNNVNTLDKERIHKASIRTRHTNIAHQKITTPNNNTKKVNEFLQKKIPKFSIFKNNIFIFSNSTFKTDLEELTNNVKNMYTLVDKHLTKMLGATKFSEFINDLTSSTTNFNAILLLYDNIKINLKKQITFFMQNFTEYNATPGDHNDIEKDATIDIRKSYTDLQAYITGKRKNNENQSSEELVASSKAVDIQVQSVNALATRIAKPLYNIDAQKALEELEELQLVIDSENSKRQTDSNA